MNYFPPHFGQFSTRLSVSVVHLKRGYEKWDGQRNGDHA